MTDVPPDRLDTMQRIELASGVEVELHPAGPLVRAKAWLLDLVWIGLIYALVGLAVGLKNPARVVFVQRVESPPVFQGH